MSHPTRDRDPQTLVALQNQINTLLQVKPQKEPEQEEAGRLLFIAPPEETPPRRFSAFRFPDVQKAKEIAAELMEEAEGVREEEGMIRAVGVALEQAAGLVDRMREAPGDDPGLARHALKLFLTHYRHELPLGIEGLEARNPLLVLPSAGNSAETQAPESEERLLWFREDPKLNEHHEHWHVVYPIAGVPNPGNPKGGQPKDRQGELFLYMHRQMLARYETERLAVGLERLVPWGYEEADPVGYDPGPYLRPSFGTRLPGKKWERTPEGDVKDPSTVWVTPQDMVERGERLFEAARSGKFSPSGGSQVPVDTNLLGMTLEADIGSVETKVTPFDPANFGAWYNSLVTSHYGNFHNVGHDMFAWLATNSAGEQQEGVMGFVPTAMRDHIFYRWHKLIDDIYLAWQETQPSHDFSTDVPPVKIRKALPGQPDSNQSPDIILCLQRDLVPWDRWDKFGKYAFGDQQWDTEFAKGEFSSPGIPEFTTTDQLLTEMRRRVVTIETGAEPPKFPEEAPHEIEYLDQEEFFYFFRLENESDAKQDVTVRVFMVPLDPPELAEDRRMWIEMDKFRQTLEPKERAVVFRPASLSSVIRKPGVKPPTAEQPPIGKAMQEKAEILGNYCDCGWPYNLLLPRATKKGMPFRLLVMLTDWNLDNVPQDGDCGSMSYCGARDKYPDKRPMGYPFDAPFERSIAETIKAAPNMATRDISIRWA